MDKGLFIDTFIGYVKLVPRLDIETNMDYYDVYNDDGRYIGELWTANIGRSLEMDVEEFLIEKGY